MAFHGVRMFAQQLPIAPELSGRSSQRTINIRVVTGEATITTTIVIA